MEFKKLFLKFKKPNKWIILVSGVLTLVFALLSLLFALKAGGENGALAIISYVIYGFAGVFLAYFVYIIVINFKFLKSNFIALLMKWTFTANLLENYGFRSVVGAILSFIFSVFVSVYNAYFGLRYGSIWFGSLAAYYILLTILRGALLSVYKKGMEKQLNIYRNCGIFILVLSFALSFAVSEMVINNHAFEKQGLLIYVAAAYAFYKITMAIINIVKAKKHNNHILQALKNVTFADALVSVLALQTALLYEFSSSANNGFFNGITGGIVCVCQIVLGIYMIVVSTKRKNKDNASKS